MADFFWLAIGAWFVAPTALWWLMARRRRAAIKAERELTELKLRMIVELIESTHPRTAHTTMWRGEVGRA